MQRRESTRQPTQLPELEDLGAAQIEAPEAVPQFLQDTFGNQELLANIEGTGSQDPIGAELTRAVSGEHGGMSRLRSNTSMNEALRRSQPEIPGPRTIEAEEAEDPLAAIAGEMIERVCSDLGLSSPPPIHVGDEEGRANTESAGTLGLMRNGEIYLNPGVDPGDRAGRQVLVHELAHVAQRRLPGSGDPAAAEQEAQRIGEQGASGGALDPVRVPLGNSIEAHYDERSTTFVEGAIVGHASPRWEAAQGNDAQRREYNAALSQQRAEEVNRYFRELMMRQFPDEYVEFGLQATSSDVPVGDLPAAGVGDQSTILEAGGDTEANEASMRRTDIEVILTHQVAGEAESESSDEVQLPHQTDQWSVRLSLSGGGGHLGPGAGVAEGELRNRRTNQVVEFFFGGAGLGAGLQTPGVVPDDWSSWTDFETIHYCGFEDFQGTMARLTTAGAGFGLGGGVAWISFPEHGANTIWVGGFNAGGFGADASMNFGAIRLSNVPAPPTGANRAVEATPYSFTSTQPHRMTVTFETASAEISDDQLAALTTFVQEVADAYRNGGRSETP